MLLPVESARFAHGRKFDCGVRRFTFYLVSELDRDSIAVDLLAVDPSSRVVVVRVVVVVVVVVVR